MSQLRDRKRPPFARNGAFFCLVSGFLVVGSALWSRFIDRQGDSLLAERVILPDDKAEPQPRHKPNQKSLYQVDPDAHFLSDSVLSLIQSYYVDLERVHTRQLLDTFVQVLNHPGVSGKLIEARIEQSDACPRHSSGQLMRDDNGTLFINVKILDQSYIWCLSENLTHADVAEIYVKVSEIIDERGLRLSSMDPSEPPEKQASALIQLYANTLSSLDAHSALLSPEAYRELRQGTEGSFGGLGVLVGIRDHLLTVIKPLPKSPAHRSGIKASDRIVGIDGKFTFGFSLEQLVEYMRGEPGTQVQLSLLRKDSSTPILMKLKREIIQVDSISTEEFVTQHSAILKIAIETFASRTSREVLNAIKDFRKKHAGRVDGLILDLRSNPGGLLDQAVQVADLFLPAGIIVSTRGRREEIEKAGSGIDELNFPMMTLIDGDSASASEIVAGALQDHGRSLIVGQPSFGKGSVQTIFELPQERALKITIARYYTPSGRSIQNVGIIPDIWLQPISPKSSNENLLGSFRYKNEGFLKNHLEAAKERQAFSTKIPSLKSYYLLRENGNSDETNTLPSIDFEKELALLILRKLSTVYHNNIPDFAFRASHWLGLTGPAVHAYCTELEQEATAWLKERHLVDWHRNHPDAFMSQPDVILNITESNESAGQTVSLGSSYKIPYLIKNVGEKKAHRMSIYVRSDLPQFDTREILIGSLNPGDIIRGTIEIKINNNWEPGPLPLRIGLAHDAWPMAQSSIDHMITIHDRNMALLETQVGLVQDGGGQLPHILESRESGKIQVIIRNKSSTPARDIQVRVVNLSGTQTHVAEADRIVRILEGNELVKLTFPITASQFLYSSSLDYGLQLESDSIRNNIKKHFTIRSIPNTDISSKKTHHISH